MKLSIEVDKLDYIINPRFPIKALLEIDFPVTWYHSGKEYLITGKTRVVEGIPTAEYIKGIDTIWVGLDAKVYR